MPSGEVIKDALQLQPGISEGQIDEFEQNLAALSSSTQEIRLPDEFRLMFRLFNGQTLGSIGNSA